MKVYNYFGRTTMFKKMLLLMVAVLFIVNGLLFAQSTMTIVDLPATGTDAAIGIDTSKTYTHTIDFGLDLIAKINGVDFLPFVDKLKSADAVIEYTSLQGYRFIVDDSRNPNVNIEAHAGSDPSDQCDGNSVDLLADMIFLSKANEVGEAILVTLKDLVPGTQYSVRYYYRAWDPDIPRPITIMADGASNGVFADSIRIDIDGGGAHYLDYTYVADDSDVTIKFAFWNNSGQGQGAHIYGLTCEVLQTTGVDSKTSTKPSKYALMQNYPNPFNPTTNIQFQIPKDGYVKISVFNILGQPVTTLIDQELKSGTHQVTFDATNFSSGIYFYRIQANGYSQVKKMMLLK